MATAFNQFRIVQAAIEGTKGTGLPATRKLRGDLVPNERINRYYSQFPQGYRANPGGTGVKVGQGFSAVYNSELTFEEILFFLLTGLKGAVTPSLTATSTNTWVFSPTLTAAPTLDSMTLEYTESDGSVNHVAREANYVMTGGLKVDWAINQEAKFSANVFGRVPASAAPTAALTYYTGREVAASNRLKVFMDSSWAGLGGTQLAGLVRSASIELMTGNEEDVNLDGRVDLDMTGYRYGLVAAKINLGLQLNADGASALGNWRAGDQRFVRLSQLGSLIEATTYKEVRFDAACRFIGDEPQRQTDGQYRNVSIQLETMLDPTSSKTLEATVVNALTAV